MKKLATVQKTKLMCSLFTLVCKNLKDVLWDNGWNEEKVAPLKEPFVLCGDLVTFLNRLWQHLEYGPHQWHEDFLQKWHKGILGQKKVLYVCKYTEWHNNTLLCFLACNRQKCKMGSPLHMYYNEMFNSNNSTYTYSSKIIGGKKLTLNFMMSWFISGMKSWSSFAPAYLSKFSMAIGM